MGTAQAARGGRRHNLSLRTLASPGARREQESVDRAFDSFYREHVADVYQYALAVLTNPTDAEDVTQQTFLNAYRAFQRGERPHTPHNWLIKIAHNVCRMRWRQSSRRPQEVSLENAAEPAASEDEKPSLDAVLSALSRLPFNQRAAIVMREVEGRSYAEIAEVLTTTVPAVEALLFRARSSLRARGKELGVLTVVPVPGSLTTFLGGGGGVAASGGALVGSGVALKAVAVVATGVVAGGLGFKSVEAIADPENQAPPAQTQSYQAAPAWASPVSRLAAPTRNRPNATFAHRTRGRAAAGGLLAKAPTNDRRSDEGLAAAPAAGSGAAAGAGAVVPPGGTILADPAATVNKIVASVPIPPVPPVPPTPPPPVELPPPPTLPTLPAVTITVPTVTLPPPPTLK